MTRTCPYCGTKIKYRTGCFTPQKAECPTCGNNPFHPVLKQLSTANIGLTILNVVVFVMNTVLLILGETIQQWPHWRSYGLIILGMQGIALLLLQISLRYLTRDCYVQKMYEWEQGWWVET